MAQLSAAEITQIETALSLYNKAIDKTKAQQDIEIRELTEEDNAGIAHVIRQVSDEFGLTEDKGYSVADPDLDQLSEIYTQNRSQYWVIAQGDKILGGGCFAT